MTSRGFDYSQISVFVPEDLRQRIADACNRAEVTRGDWLLSCLKKAVEDEEQRIKLK